MQKFLKNNYSQKKKANFQERKTSKKLDISMTKNSGAGKVKCDLISHKKKVAIECKRTDKKSISLKLEWIEKLQNETKFTDKLPLIEIQFGNKSYFLIADENFPIDSFIDFLNKR
jgi:Holliday junction resolvase